MVSTYGARRDKNSTGRGPSEIRSAVMFLNFTGQSKGKIVYPAG